MAKYQIDINSYTSITCSVAPKPVMNRQTGQQRADTNGEPLYSVELVAFGHEGGFGDEGAHVLPVKFPGTPNPGLKPGVAVKVTGLVVSDWEMAAEQKHGLSFRAARIEPLSGAQAPKAGAA